MDHLDRKRPHDGSDSPLEYVSKKPLNRLSEDGPLTQNDIVYFKKEAIWRQMKYYKIQAAELQRQIAGYEKRCLAFFAVHLLLENWYVLVVSVLKSNLENKELQANSIAKLDLSLNEDEIQLLLEDRRSTLVSLFLALGTGSVSESLEKSIVQFSELVALKADKDKTEHLYQELQDKLVQIELQLEQTIKENDRKDSKSLARASTNNHIKTEEPSKTEQTQENGTTKLDSLTSSSAKQTQEQSQALEALQIEITEIKAGNESLESRLKEALSKVSIAENAVTDLTLRLGDLSESDLLKSRQYMALLEQKNTLSENLAQTLLAKENLVAKYRQLEEKEGNFVKGVSHELEDENLHLKGLLSKAENDLVRIRTARDELLGKQAVLKLELENRATNEELSKLNTVLSERLKSLEESKQVIDNADPAFEALEKPELIKRLQILNGELKDIESAFHSTRDINLARLKDVVDREGLMKKLNIEKNKADQKYFASMRLKDLLVAENKVLKTQVTKSQELVTKFEELEKSYLGKIELLVKSVDEYRAIKESSIHENAKLQETVKKLTKVRELASKDVNSLREELAVVKKNKTESENEFNAQKTRESRLKAKLQATENLLTKYKQNNTSLILQEDEKQLEALRSITKCSVCSKHWKNTAITACGHVFCDGCVQERLAARLRRCPTCNKGFSSNDLLSIHL